LGSGAGTGARDDLLVETDRTPIGEVHVLACAECPRVSGVTARGWKAYRTDDIETIELPALAFYCPECARREFGAV
jgi:hypothetical protein